MTGLIILAAGPSSRLGEPKQQLFYKGKSLLQHAVEAAIRSHCKQVIVVLGANAATIKTEIKDEPVIIIENEEWPEGMASSIRKGIAALQKIEPNIADVVLMVCDQPFVDSFLINKLIKTKTVTGKNIVACSYKNTLGVPVLFDKIHFAELLLLQGQEGAKKLLGIHKDSVAEISFAQGETDIDTQQDYEALQKN